MVVLLVAVVGAPQRVDEKGPGGAANALNQVTTTTITTTTADHQSARQFPAGYAPNRARGPFTSVSFACRQATR